MKESFIDWPIKSTKLVAALSVLWPFVIFMPFFFPGLEDQFNNYMFFLPYKDNKQFETYS